MYRRGGVAGGLVLVEHRLPIRTAPCTSACTGRDRSRSPRCARGRGPRASGLSPRGRRRSAGSDPPSPAWARTCVGAARSPAIAGADVTLTARMTHVVATLLVRPVLARDERDRRMSAAPGMAGPDHASQSGYSTSGCGRTARAGAGSARSASSHALPRSSPPDLPWGRAVHRGTAEALFPRHEHAGLRFRALSAYSRRSSRRSLTTPPEFEPSQLPSVLSWLASARAHSILRGAGDTPAVRPDLHRGPVKLEQGLPHTDPARRRACAGLADGRSACSAGSTTASLDPYTAARSP